MALFNGCFTAAYEQLDEETHTPSEWWDVSVRTFKTIADF